MMLIETAVARRLKADEAVVRLATGGIFKHTLESDVATTGRAALVVSTGGSWRRTLQTAKFPRVYVRVHADDDRSTSGGITTHNADDKCLALLAEADRVLHVPFRFMAQWGGDNGPWVLGCNREIEPVQVKRPGDSVVMYQTVYDLKVA